MASPHHDLDPLTPVPFEQPPDADREISGQIAEDLDDLIAPSDSERDAPEADPAAPTDAA